MAAVLMETLEKTWTEDLTGRKCGYKDLADEKHREFLRGMAWALCLVRGYELAMPETGDKAYDEMAIQVRDKIQGGIAEKLGQDCSEMLRCMIEEEQGGADT